MINLVQIRLLFEVFQRGRSVSNPVAWKHGQITVTALAPVLVVSVELARTLGMRIPVTQDQLVAIAGLIIAAVNVVCTIITTTKIGISPRELPPISEPDIKAADGTNVDINSPDTRASLGYERVGGTTHAPVFGGGVSNNRDNAGG